ncbi:MAG: tetratricopeptide repeat protein [Gammaproteobacteria bacterium]
MIERARELTRSGRLAEAEQICRDVLATDAANHEAHSALGGIALQAGQIDAAVTHFSRAIEIDARQPGGHQGLGIAYFNLRQYDEALVCFRRAADLDRRNPAAHNNLGNACKQAGQLRNALRSYRKAIAVSPKYLPAYINLADLLGKQRQHKAAVKAYRKALRVGDDTPENQANLAMLHHRLGLALRELDRTDEAISSYRDAIARQPDFALAHNSLGGALLARNELQDAMTCFRTALAHEPAFSRVHSNILLTMNYVADATQQQIYDESQKFDTQHAAALRERAPFHNSKSRKKTLRVGYLSPDFREHSVAHFTRTLLGTHNREVVEVYCYADVEKPDDLTGQFQAQADHWLAIDDLPDEEVAARIRQDGIDILVDLAGHTSNNRLMVFARKPAPIQVNWLGYPNTTGMRAIDYRLTDAIADPPGEADRLHVEKLVRLERGFLCYQTTEMVPAVAPPPSRARGYVTFGSFNMIRKVSPDVVRAWSSILRSVAGSRILLKSNALEDEGTRTRLLDAFGAHEIDPDRIELVNAVPSRSDHLELYSRIDIGLDPFPYNGTTTSFEAIWMGVPVVCLRGDRHAARVGASIMHHIGLPDLVADSEDDYVHLAQSLAGDAERLAALRNMLRPQLLDSVLMDVTGFAESLEDAYRKMWITYCG